MFMHLLYLGGTSGSAELQSGLHNRDLSECGAAQDSYWTGSWFR